MALAPMENGAESQDDKSQDNSKDEVEGEELAPAVRIVRFAAGRTPPAAQAELPAGGDGLTLLEALVLMERPFQTGSTAGATSAATADGARQGEAAPAAEEVSWRRVERGSTVLLQGSEGSTKPRVAVVHHVYLCNADQAALLQVTSLCRQDELLAAGFTGLPDMASAEVVYSGQPREQVPAAAVLHPCKVLFRNGPTVFITAGRGEWQHRRPLAALVCKRWAPASSQGGGRVKPLDDASIPQPSRAELDWLMRRTAALVSLYEQRNAERGGAVVNKLPPQAAAPPAVVSRPAADGAASLPAAKQGAGPAPAAAVAEQAADEPAPQAAGHTHGQPGSPTQQVPRPKRPADAPVGGLTPLGKRPRVAGGDAQPPTPRRAGAITPVQQSSSWLATWRADAEKAVEPPGGTAAALAATSAAAEEPAPALPAGGPAAAPPPGPTGGPVAVPAVPDAGEDRPAAVRLAPVRTTRPVLVDDSESEEVDILDGSGSESQSDEAESEEADSDEAEPMETSGADGGSPPASSSSPPIDLTGPPVDDVGSRPAQPREVSAATTVAAAPAGRAAASTGAREGSLRGRAPASGPPRSQPRPQAQDTDMAEASSSSGDEVPLGQRAARASKAAGAAAAAPGSPDSSDGGSAGSAPPGQHAPQQDADAPEASGSSGDEVPLGQRAGRMSRGVATAAIADSPGSPDSDSSGSAGGAARSAGATRPQQPAPVGAGRQQGATGRPPAGGGARLSAGGGSATVGGSSERGTDSAPVASGAVLSAMAAAGTAAAALAAEAAAASTSDNSSELPLRQLAQQAQQPQQAGAGAAARGRQAAGRAAAQPGAAHGRQGASGAAPMQAVVVVSSSSASGSSEEEDADGGSGGGRGTDVGAAEGKQARQQGQAGRATGASQAAPPKGRGRQIAGGKQGGPSDSGGSAAMPSGTASAPPAQPGSAAHGPQTRPFTPPQRRSVRGTAQPLPASAAEAAAGPGSRASAPAGSGGRGAADKPPRHAAAGRGGPASTSGAEAAEDDYVEVYAKQGKRKLRARYYVKAQELKKAASPTGKSPASFTVVSPQDFLPGTLPPGGNAWRQLVYVQGDDQQRSLEEWLEASCRVCGLPTQETCMLMCENNACEMCYHTFCLKPPRKGLPPDEEPWYCPECSGHSQGASTMRDKAH